MTFSVHCALNSRKKCNLWYGVAPNRPADREEKFLKRGWTKIFHYLQIGGEKIREIKIPISRGFFGLLWSHYRIIFILLTYRSSWRLRRRSQFFKQITRDSNHLPKNSTQIVLPSTNKSSIPFRIDVETWMRSEQSADANLALDLVDDMLGLVELLYFFKNIHISQSQVEMPPDSWTSCRLRRAKLGLNWWSGKD